jgi:hypothetical protein
MASLPKPFTNDRHEKSQKGIINIHGDSFIHASSCHRRHFIMMCALNKKEECSDSLTQLRQEKEGKK